MKKALFRVFDRPMTLLLVVLSILCSPLQAQSPLASSLADPPVTVTARQGATFEAALQALASQTHMTILAEGVPLKKQQPALTLLALPPNSPASAALGALAEDYDYTVQRQENIFLLVKRHSDPNDLPDVTPEECAQALDDMAQVMGALNPGPPPEDRDSVGPHFSLQIAQIAATLTPAQFQAMEQKTADQGLSVASLSNVSRLLVRRFVLTNYVYDQLTEVKKERYQLGLAADAKLYVKRSRQISTRTVRVSEEPPLVQTIVQNTSFGFDLLHNSVLVFFPLDDNTAFIASSLAQSSAPLPDPTPEPSSRGEGYTTLGAVAETLNACGARVIVSPALTAKTLTVSGVEATAPEKLLKAVATIYGLRYFKDEEGRRRLTRPLIRVPLTVTGLPDALRRVLPLPLLRALHDGEAEREYQERQKQPPPKAPQSEADVLKLMREQSSTDKKNMARYTLPDTLHRIAMAQLRGAFEAQLAVKGTTVKRELARAESTRRIPLSALPLSARSAFAVARMTDLLEWMLHFMGREAPEWAADPDACYLTGGLHPDPTRPGTQVFTMAVATANAKGSLQDRVVTSTDYTP